MPMIIGLSIDANGIPASGAFGAGVLGILYLFWRIQRTLVRDTERRLLASDLRDQLCQWRLSVLQNASFVAGVKIPERMWSPPHIMEQLADAGLIEIPADPERG